MALKLAGEGSVEVAHQGQHQTAQTDALAGNLDANARVGVRKNGGTDVGKRRRLNLNEGSNVTLTVTDDPTSEEVDVTIAASGGGAGTPADVEEDDTLVKADADPLNFTHGLDVTLGPVNQANIAVDEGELDHALLGGVTADQHHAQNHASRHQPGGADIPAILDPTSELRAPRKTDPATPVAGELWINSTDLKYRDNQATPATQRLLRAGEGAGGDLGGTYPNPTVNTTHAGSAHHPQSHALTGADHTASGLTDGHALRATGATTFAFEVDYTSVNFIIDGGGSAITTGSKGHLRIPFGAVLDRWSVYADQSGSVTVDVKKGTHTDFPTLTSMPGGAGNKPTLTSAQKNEATPASWSTTTINSDDILEFVVDSAATVQRVTVELRLRRT